MVFLYGFINPNWWIFVIIASLVNGCVYSNEIDEATKVHERAVNRYAYDTQELKRLESQLARGGTICNDGWRSSSYGSGTCSHHGGIDRTISRDKYNNLSLRIIKDSYDRDPENFKHTKKSIRDDFISWEIFIIFLSLLVCRMIKNSEVK